MINYETVRFKAEFALIMADEIKRKAEEAKAEELKPKPQPKKKKLKVKAKPKPKVNTEYVSKHKGWMKYRKKVWDITNKQKIKTLANHEKRAFRGYHLDHKVSIWYGFHNKIDPRVIGNIDNLEFIPYKDNMKKGVRVNEYKMKPMQTCLFI